MELLQAVLSLPDDEREKLVEALLVESEPANHPHLDEWMAEVQRRSAEIDAGTAKLTPWSEVKRRVSESVE